MISCVTTQPVRTGKPLGSLCKLDFREQVCWTNEEKREGIPFMVLDEKQLACEKEGACFFMIDGLDLARIHRTLNRCSFEEK